MATAQSVGNIGILKLLFSLYHKKDGRYLIRNLHFSTGLALLCASFTFAWAIVKRRPIWTGSGIAFLIAEVTNQDYIIITEGEKKALNLYVRGFSARGL